jgi:choline kinase
MVKKIRDKARIVENQLFDSTNNSESLRLAVNNTHRKGILFVHGDLLFNAEALNMDYTKSFVVVDTKGQMEKKEVGVTIEDNGIASIFSYGLECKWGQIAYITGKELRIARQIFSKFEPQHKKMLSFEILNKIIESGGVFKCHEPDGMILFEIDKIRKNI